VTVLHALRESGLMFWDTLWALVLGFGLSGAVQAFVSRETMQAHLGDHRAGSVGRATFYGTISSSCSYAASAMARSLFAKGADFVAAMVFMFASTNLVVELGVVLAVLIGWEFVAAEVVGGIIMIVLLVALGGLWFRGRALDEAARRVADADGHGGHEHHHGGGSEAAEREPWRRRVRTASGWSDAAGYTMSDLTMLRKELVIGFVVAGMLAQWVPVHVWNDVFIHGHGFATELENAFVGPLVALISCVCSVGNVPLAAALWHGGISFGGVVSFVFADLIALPILLVYRKQYGPRMAWRMLAGFWLVMAVAGLVTGALFQAVGLVPHHRPAAVAADHFTWGPTTILDIAALLVFTGLYWLSRHQDRFGGGAGYAKDPVCAMQIETAHAPALATVGGTSYWFCSESCRDRFVANPDRYLKGATGPEPVLVPAPAAVQLRPTRSCGGDGGEGPAPTS
jgi:uncharacterized membrane protein YraQ (UPF0718 family)/YHS domain-containing protein